MTVRWNCSWEEKRNTQKKQSSSHVVLQSIAIMAVRRRWLSQQCFEPYKTRPKLTRMSHERTSTGPLLTAHAHGGGEVSLHSSASWSLRRCAEEGCVELFLCMCPCEHAHVWNYMLMAEDVAFQWCASLQEACFLCVPSALHTVKSFICCWHGYCRWCSIFVHSA